MWSTLRALWELVSWIRAQRKAINENAEAYFSMERADNWRLFMEQAFKALEDGPANPNFSKLPRIVKWLCSLSQVDETIGRFGQRWLKSGKLAVSDPVLRAPMYNAH